ncbi:LuxR C-terminal-related transcriptional regulator [Rhodococcus artemisiae]|uniref:LuxR C-terminal-related transcriptional regulator n=1 Tax=Rhodococcus artemisiae TaxID=714159 RepID=A0ABU7LHI9_9NOCA|nr:LuxR C-terminal-related transcriptional regulator [Rhodococcus artemisiae]MEE2060719.1 LuxR C-terminal-related transcriptional regulator [Rhodococcus artemisiae]
MNADEWFEIHQCRGEGESIKGIAQRLGISRNTVRRALAMPEQPNDHRRLKGSVADEADARIRDLLQRSPSISIAEIGRCIMWSHSRTLLVRKVNQIKSEMSTVPFDPPSIGTGLPQHPTSFVGRNHELREVRRLLGVHRLVSVVGPGGIGKTRLVVRAAEEYRRAFADGIRFVELASLRSESLVSQAIADRLGLETRDGPDSSADDILVEYLRNRRMLLILDNCEHLVDGIAALVSRLTEETSNLRILTTSREYLAIPGEYVFHLPPLSIDGGRASGAVELFANRAESVLSGFELSDSNVDAVRRICRRLDGLPLAIELACTRLNVLSVEDLAERLDRRLSMLTVSARGRTPRHRSLQATIDWSYELCSETERILWCRTSVFADSFDMGMAVAVCSDDALSEDEIMEAVAALVSKSVVVREISDNGVRFRLLESMREYGWGKQTIPERRHMNERLLEYCARIVEESTTSWYGPEQLTKATAVSINRGNIRAALHSVMNNPTDPALVRLAADTLGSSRFLWACGISVREHRMWLTQALDLPGISRTARGRILTVLALVQTLQGDRDAADFTLRRAREIAGDREDPVTRSFAVHIAGLRDFFAGRADTGMTYLDEAERGYRLHGCDPELVSMLQIHRGMLLCSTQDVSGAAAAFSRVFTMTDEIGELWFHSYATYGLGHVALLENDPDTAVQRALEALRYQRQFADPIGKTVMADLLGWALAEQGHGERAAVVLGAASSMWGSIGRQLYGADHWNTLRARAVDTARHHVGGSAFDAAWARGQAMTAPELLAYIFDEDCAEHDHPAPDRSYSAHTTATTDTSQLELLSPREREVAELVAQGLTNKQIAEKLVLSSRTVEGHVEHLLRKLCLSRRTEVPRALFAT